jgi:hypothetical protein
VLNLGGLDALGQAMEDRGDLDLGLQHFEAALPSS